MKPIDFILEASSGPENTKASALFEGLQKDIRIFSSNHEWEILSYYYHPLWKCFVLDIEIEEK